MKKWDVVIIGSGISSLTAATILSSKGMSVCVLEQYVKPGGYLHSFNRFGHRFETGSHYVGAMGEGQPFRRLLEYLGVYDDETFIPLDPDAFDVMQFPSFRFEFPAGYDRLIPKMIDAFPAERAGIARFFQRVRETIAQFPTYSFNADYDESTVNQALTTTLAAVVDSCVTDPRLKSLLYAHCAVHGVHPSDIAFGLHCLVIDSMIRGPYGFRHGGDRLAENFVKRIRANGGEVRLRAKVSRLASRDKVIQEIELASGEILHADWVISGAHPKSTFRLIADTELTPAFRGRLDRLRESTAVFGLYALCSEAPEIDPLRNYYFFGEEDSARLFTEPTSLTSPQFVYVARPDRGGSEPGEEVPVTLHSPGPYAWFAPWAGTKTSARPPEYGALKNRIADGLLSFLDGQLPGFRSRIRKFETSTALTNLHFNGSEEGSAYGIYHSMENTGARALGPRSHIRNLLLTGQSSLCPGLLAGAVSGLRSAGSLVGVKPLIRDLAEGKTL